MGNPIFRFRLVHALAGTYEISEPGGWRETTLSLTRDDNFHSLIENFSGSFFFYGNNGLEDGGVDFIRHVEQTYGFDTALEIDIDLSVNDGQTYQDIFNGLYDFSMTEENNLNQITSAIKRNDFWSKFISRIDTPVDILSPTDLDGDSVSVLSPIDVRMTAQKLRQIYFGESITFGPDESLGTVSATTGIPDDSYLQLDWANEILDEIEEKYNLPLEVNSALPAFNFSPDYGGLFRFQIRITASILRFSGGFEVENFSVKSQDSPNWPEASTDFVDFYLRINGVDHLLHWVESFDTGFIPPRPIGTQFYYDDYHDINPNDEIRIYGKMNAEFSPTPDPGESFFFTWNGFSAGAGGGLAGISSLRITADTTYPESTSDSFFLHDVGAAACARITGSDQSFYSQTLGNSVTSRVYPSNGCNSFYTLMKGLQVRQYTLIDKPYFSSFQEWWDGANPIFNLGLGYDVINGQEVIRVETKDHFYNETIKVNLSYIRDIVRTYDESSIYNRINVGYKRWESETISGIDDPQTKHTYATRLQTIGDEINIESSFMAASLAIEETRRQTIVKSKDYKLDNETFIVSIRDSVSSPDVYLPELDENFTEINNLLNADTRYNSRITPARNLLRWINHLNGCLQSYLTSVYRFVSGQGNFDMNSVLVSSCDPYDGSLSEKGNIEVTDTFLHLPDYYTFTVDLSWEEYAIIRGNRNNAIGISMTDEGHVPFFIKELNFEPCNSRAKITGWPKEKLVIRNTDFVAPNLQCAQTFIPATGCTDAILTELLSELITEDGDCLILE